MKKQRKTTIWLTTSVTTFVKASYEFKKIVDRVVGTHTFFYLETRCIDIYYQVFVDDVMQPALFDDDLAEGMPKGFNHSLIIHPVIGSTILVKAYRVPATIDVADYIGHCCGVFTEKGYQITEQENVTVRDEFKAKKIRK